MGRDVTTWRVARFALLVVVVVVVVACTSDDNDLDLGGEHGDNVFRVPPAGQVLPAISSGGDPIFVVHHEDDSVSVVSAVATHKPWGIRKLVGWCWRSRSFEEPVHGILGREMTDEEIIFPLAEKPVRCALTARFGRIDERTRLL